MKILNRLSVLSVCLLAAFAATAQDAPVAPAAQPVVGRRTFTPRDGAATRARNAANAAAASTLPAEGSTASLPALKFEQSPVDMVLAAYAEVTGLTLLLAPDIPKTAITLRSNTQTELTQEKYLEAIERILNMNGIVLIPVGDTFLRVENSKTVMKRGFETGFAEAPEEGVEAKGQFVSQMVQLKHLPVDEARKAIEGFKRDDGQIQLFERTNSILILDSAENLNRMLEVIKYIDQPLVIREEVNVRPIRFAKAADIKKRLDEIVADSKKESQGKESVQTKTSGSPGVEAVRPLTLPPGVVRSRRFTRPAAAEPEASPNAVIETLVSDAERGMIRGRVNIMADERSNQLIIITSTENMIFFDRLITVLDVETAPDVMVEVMRLEHADAEEVAKMINDLIGNASKKDDAPQSSTTPAGEAKTQTLAEAVEARRAARVEVPVAEGAGPSKVGELNKDNIKVLADKRINGVIIMASRNDVATLKSVINSMDIMLSQVLIETVVLEVGLGNGLEAGVDWIKQIDSKNNPGLIIGGAGENVIQNFIETVATNVLSGIAYYAKFNSLDLGVVVKAAANDDRSKVLASPVIQTMDNKEATIKATDLIYLFNGKKAVYVGGETTYEEDYVQKEIGITVTVTPRINAKGNVVMTVKQIFQNKGTPQTVTVGKTSAKYETTTTREINADVIVDTGQTIILGGLVRKTASSSKSGLPFLSTLPYIGWIFGKTVNKETRSELLVFLTPHVFSTQSEASFEAQRRREAIGQAGDGLWTQDWSGSPLAEPMPVKDVLRREKTRISREEEALKSAEALEKLHEAEQKKKEKAAAKRLKDAVREDEDLVEAVATPLPPSEVVVDISEALPEPEPLLKIVVDVPDAAPVLVEPLVIEPLLAPAE